MYTQHSRLGIEYLSKLRDKPKFNLIYHSSEEFAKEAKDQDLAFQQWNLYVRLRLEQYYRVSVVLAFCIFLQNLLILIFLWGEMNLFYKLYTIFNSLNFIILAWTTFRLQKIKITE